MTVHAATFEASPQIRPPPTAVKLLLPVWGFRYINQFLEFCLPTLLAPGNVPALAKALPCEFHLMTSAADAPIIAEHPAWRVLQRICQVKIELIDDLITDSNHSTTITLAFSRAVRATGPRMVDTCFINICADYLFSDRALENVLKRINAGASAVLAGNFQIVAEDGLAPLRRKIDPARVELPISSRELIRCGVTYLHPATVANMVNFGLFHNEHTNRLFWRVDDSTLIGRFYLLHVVCVRPEVAEFVTGSSFDYSFIPEMCPSNNVVVFTDSDDYFVLEIQGRNHEANQLRSGPLDPTDLAISLMEWTTARHRENATYTVVFHAEDIPDAVTSVTAKADEFIARITEGLKNPPQPHRNHPYWIGAIIAHLTATGQAENADLMEAELGRRPESQSRTLALLWRLRMSLYGTFPELRACHPYWPDFRLPLEKLKNFLAKNKRALIVSSTPNAYTPWLARRSKSSVKMESARLLNMTDLQYKGLFGRFDVCLMHLTERDLKLGDVYIDRVAPLLASDGVLLFVVSNQKIDELTEFKQSFAYHSVRFGNLALSLDQTHYISTTIWRSFVQQKIVQIGRLARRRPVLGLPIAAIFGPPLLLASYICNRTAAVGSPMPANWGYCSSVFMEMSAVGRTENGWHPRFNVGRETIRSLDRADVAREMSPQMDFFDDELLYISPSNNSLVASMARYRFAAKLLSGRSNVCQIGYDRSAGPDLVRPVVGALVIYVNQAEVSAAIMRRYQNDSAIAMELHDIRLGRLPASYDAFYSFDALERVAPEDENNVLRHIRQSLSRESDVAIIGCPARTPDAASETTGGPYRRGGIQFRSLVSQHFDMVLMFSMVEDEIQAGLLASADYYLAVASGRHN